MGQRRRGGGGGVSGETRSELERNVKRRRMEKKNQNEGDVGLVKRVYERNRD